MSVSRRLPPVVIEYDYRGRRKRRHFEDAYEGRRFFTKKFKEGKNPTVLRTDSALSYEEREEVKRQSEEKRRTNQFPFFS